MGTPFGLLNYELTNAVLGWAILGVVLLVAIQHLLRGEFLWAGMAVAVIAVALVPPALSRRPNEMIAWESLVLCAFPVVAQSVGFLVEPAAYLAISALALVIAVELDTFTAVEMTSGFAVAFVDIATLAVAGLWAIGRFVSDIYLGTSLLSDQTALMWDFVIAIGVGVAAGIGFEVYFRQIDSNKRVSPNLSRRAQ